MTITKRKALHGRTLDCLTYIMDPNKTDYRNLVTGINCNPNFAFEQMLMVNNLYGNRGNRVGYHAIQAFNYTDDITPEKAHEIGLQLAQELYADYQVVVATHIDKGHIHNHFCFNSINIHTGKKLEDRLSSIEGIAHLREVSDRISKENNLTVLEKAPPIGKYKNRNYLMHFANKSWRQNIIRDIDRLLIESNNFEHLLELLSLDGYMIQHRGKSVSVKVVGMDRYLRFQKLSKDGQYSESALRDKIYKIKNSSFNTHARNKHVGIMTLPASANTHTLSETEKMQLQIKLENNKVETLLRKQDDIVERNKDKKFNAYQKRSYNLRVKMNKINEALRLLNHENINSIDDLILKEAGYIFDLNELKEEYDILKKDNMKYQQLVPVLKIFTEYYQLNELIEEEEKITARSMENTYKKELRLFNEAKVKLNQYAKVEGIEDTKKLLNKINRKKMLANDHLININLMTDKITCINRLKEFYLQKNGSNQIAYTINVSNNMIISETDMNYRIKLPYADNEYVYVDKESTYWKTYKENLCIFLMEDIIYDIFDKEDALIKRSTGDEIEENISNQKKQYNSLDGRSRVFNINK